MKYIVDTDDFEPMFKVDSIGVFGIGKSVTDNTEDHSWSRIKSIEDFEELNSDYINEHFGDLQDEAYKRGLQDGKEVIHNGCEGCRHETTRSECCKLCCNNYSNLWQKQDDEINVGDEVEWTGDKYIVTYINYDIDTSEITDYDLLGDDGSVADHVKKCSFTKTGRHFDIESILEDMRE